MPKRRQPRNLTQRWVTAVQTRHRDGRATLDRESVDATLGDDHTFATLRCWPEPLTIDDVEIGTFLARRGEVSLGRSDEGSGNVSTDPSFSIVIREYDSSIEAPLHHVTD